MINLPFMLRWSRMAEVVNGVKDFFPVGRNQVRGDRSGDHFVSAGEGLENLVRQVIRRVLGMYF